MRKLFTFALASALAFSAQANEWRQFTSTMYVLDPVGEHQLLAMASLFEGKQVVMNLVDVSGAFCEKGQSSKPMPAGPYQINGTNVKFIQACLGGKRVLSPETEKGKAFLLNAILSGPATVVIEGGDIVKFSSENFEAAKKAMLETNSAL